MPTTNLTDRKIDSLKPGKETVYWYDSKIKGLGIRVSAKGTKTWFLHYRFLGSRPRMKLGRYPSIPLADARKKAQKALAFLSDGKDPSEAKKSEKAARMLERLNEKTFAQLSKLYIDEYAIHKKSRKEDERIIHKLLVPHFGAWNAKEITRPHIRAFLRALALKTPTQANRTRACLSKIFNWAIDEEVIALESNPAARLSNPGGKEKPKERSLRDEELQSVWKELETNSTAVKRSLQLILLTGQRPGEVVGITWGELEMNDATRSVWTLPGNRVKNGVTNLVPLSTQALRVIEKQRAALDFQNEKREARGKKAIKSAFLFPSRHVLKEKSMTVYALDQEAQRISNELNLPRFTPHDLRRTCATKLGQMQVPGHIIARVLNHKQTDITSAVYNQYEYLKEKKEALDKLGCWIVKLASGLELVHVPSTEA